MDLVIFGGTGDLAYKKLYPALYNLHKAKMLPEKMKLIAIGTKPLDDNEFSKRIAQSIKKQADDDDINNLFCTVRYISGDAAEDDIYLNLSNELTSDERIYYLAVMPKLFDVIVSGLMGHDLISTQISRSKVIVEKPFGHDEASALQINDTLSKAFGEEHIYRIDHYLGKEMTLNISALRFANAIFEPALNNRHVENIQISIFEEEGVGSRGRYYDNAGAIKDMLQNHMLQLLSLAVMQKPSSLLAKDVAKEKVKILKSLALSDQQPYIGQYEGYRDEKDVAFDSQTETFVVIKTGIDSDRWKGTNIYLRTGKKMSSKYACIVYEMKRQGEQIYKGVTEPNRIVITIQPKEGILVSFNLKNPGAGFDIGPVKMDFCQTCRYGPNSPEAYERLFLDVFNGDKSSFTSWGEVRYSWKFVDKIEAVIKPIRKDILMKYPAGSRGPKDNFDIDGGWYEIEE